MFPSSWALCWGSHFLLPQRWENEKKLFTQNQMRHRGFCIWDIRPGVLDHLQSVKLIPELYTLESGSYFLFPQRGKKWEKWIRTKWDDTSDMGNILRPCCQSGVDRGITLKRAGVRLVNKKRNIGGYAKSTSGNCRASSLRATRPKRCMCISRSFSLNICLRNDKSCLETKMIPQWDWDS